MVNIGAEYGTNHGCQFICHDGQQKAGAASAEESIDQVYRLRANELKRLDPAMRNRLLEEVHGVNEPIQETPIFLEEKLRDFRHTIDNDRRLAKNKQAYNVARLMNTSFVDDPRMHLMALRAENFDVINAAKRYVAHFEFKLELFGIDLLARPINHDDLDPEDLASLRLGFFQIMQKRDRTGRLVSVTMQEHQKFSSYKSLYRMLFYFTMRNFDDENIQRKGSVAIMYNVGMSNPQQNFREQMYYGAKFMASLLIRTTALHYCYDDCRLHSAIAAFQILLGKSIRMRFCGHFGPHVQILYKLATYGIDVDSFPIDASGNLRLNDHHRSIAFFAEEERSRVVDPNVILVSSRDVLFGCGNSAKNFPGNLALTKIVEDTHSAYSKSGKTARGVIFTRVIGYIQGPEVRGRFLIRTSDNSWRVATYEETREKVSHTFRNFSRR